MNAMETSATPAHLLATPSMENTEAEVLLAEAEGRESTRNGPSEVGDDHVHDISPCILPLRIR